MHSVLAGGRRAAVEWCQVQRPKMVLVEEEPIPSPAVRDLAVLVLVLKTCTSVFFRIDRPKS